MGLPPRARRLGTRGAGHCRPRRSLATRRIHTRPRQDTRRQVLMRATHRRRVVTGSTRRQRGTRRRRVVTGLRRPATGRRRAATRSRYHSSRLRANSRRHTGHTRRQGAATGRRQAILPREDMGHQRATRRPGVIRRRGQAIEDDQTYNDEFI